MTLKHRRIHLFLQIFFLLTGLYEGYHILDLFVQPDLSQTLFIPQDGQLPVITLFVHILAWYSAYFQGSRYGQGPFGLMDFLYSLPGYYLV